MLTALSYPHIGRTLDPVSVTIFDVARHVGVSIKTVSRVINNDPVVSEDTRAKVMAAVRELGYVPNVSARRLASRRSYVVGLVFHNATWAYITEVQQGVLETCRKEGYGMLIHPCNAKKSEDQQEILRLVAQQQVDGFIFTPPCDNAVALLEELEARRIPFVRLTPCVRQGPSPFVAADDWRGAYEMTEHLINLGHRRIGFIMGNPDHQASHDRLAGFKAALEAHRIPFNPALIQQGDFQFESGVTCARALLGMEPRPTAIFASNDDMAAGVLAVAHQMGISIPADLSVAGFDDVPLARQVWPALTTIRQPIYEIAVSAAQLLIRLLKGESVETSFYELPTTLIVRESTGPVGDPESLG
ncbi:MAG TPA: LacI family transcriptional regulator [Caldilineae bacterium]|jgi:LacI family transcriptional regulator|nr:LacI family transcriptional regulator [Caldilineae bacterium]